MNMTHLSSHLSSNSYLINKSSVNATIFNPLTHIVKG